MHKSFFSIKSYKRFISMAENQFWKVSVPPPKNLPSLNFESGYGPAICTQRIYSVKYTCKIVLVLTSSSSESLPLAFLPTFL